MSEYESDSDDETITDASTDDDSSSDDETVVTQPSTNTFWSSSWFQTHVANEIQQAMSDYESEEEEEMSVATPRATARV